MRRIYIIPKDTEVTQKIREEAQANNCPEIVIGIPPALKDELRFQKLPLVYEEPELPIAEPPRDLGKEIDDIKTRVDKLEKK